MLVCTVVDGIKSFWDPAQQRLYRLEDSRNMNGKCDLLSRWKVLPRQQGEDAGRSGDAAGEDGVEPDEWSESSSSKRVAAWSALSSWSERSFQWMLFV